MRRLFLVVAVVALALDQVVKIAVRLAAEGVEGRSLAPVAAEDAAGREQRALDML